MDSNTFNATKELVRAILDLTEEQRRAFSEQSLCQLVYCIFSINDQDDNGTCVVTSTTEVKKQENLYFISIAKYISLYIYPIFIFMGILGNSLSCFIMFLNVRRNGYPANLYLALLAFVDCLFLLGSALPDWLSRIDYKLDIKLVSDFCCRLVYWFGHFTTHLSAGLVVSVTVERFFAVQYPLIAHKINTVAHTHIALIFLITFFFLLDSRVFVLVKHFHESVHIVSTCYNETSIKYERRDIFRCGTTTEHNEQTWVFIDSAVYTLIPFLIIVTLNSLIIHRLIDSQRLRQRMFYSNKQPTKYVNQELRRFMSDCHQTVTEKRRHLRRCRSAPSRIQLAVMLRPQTNERHLRVNQSSIVTQLSLEIKIRSQHQCENSLIRQTSNTNNTRLTILLLFVSCSFLALTLPAVVLNLILSTKFQTRSTNFNHPLSSTNENMNSNANPYYTIARLLMIINHSINFILYFVVGKRFRRDLKKLFIVYWRK